jgi:hypothetical protein
MEPLEDRQVLSNICFGTALDYSVGLQPRAIVTADMNHDGRLDLVTADRASNQVSVLLNHGDGTFTGARSYRAGRHPTNVAVADMDADGNPDVLVTLRNQNGFAIMKNDGTGALARKQFVSTGRGWPHGLAVGDLDRDGDTDVVVTNSLPARGYYYGRVVMVENLGTGKFRVAARLEGGKEPLSVSTADLNGDGSLDLAIGIAYADYISVYLNRGAGRLGPQTFPEEQEYTVGDNPYHLVAADLNGDSRLDLAVSNWSSETISVLYNLGGGSFASAIHFPALQRPQGILAGDWDGDGLLDLAVTNSLPDVPATVAVLANHGDGTLGLPMTYPVGARPYAMGIGDLNGDSRIDLAVANLDSSTVSVLLNTPCP